MQEHENILDAVRQEVIDDIMSLKKEEVGKQKLWKEIEKFQQEKKELDEALIKLPNWSKKSSVCQKILEQLEQSRSELALYETQSQLLTERISSCLHNERNKLETLKNDFIVKIEAIKNKVKDREQCQAWEKQLKGEKKSFEKLFCKLGIKKEYQPLTTLEEQAIALKNNLAEQAIALKNKCLENNTEISEAQPQEEIKLKPINFRGKIQPQGLRNNAWTETQNISSGINMFNL
jgi:hypothetical protein